jgi:hypothetical protein
MLIIFNTSAASAQWYPLEPNPFAYPRWQPPPYQPKERPKPKPERPARHEPRHERRAASKPASLSQDDERSAIHDRVLDFCRRYPKDQACPKEPPAEKPP